MTSNGEPIDGQTGSSLLLTPAHVGAKIAVSVTGERAGTDAKTVTSTATAAVAPGTLVASTPKISGPTKVGNKLRVTVAAWSPDASYSYTWYANGKVIAKANTTSLTLSKSLVGKTIKVRVTGTAEGYAAKSVYSASTAKIRK